MMTIVNWIAIFLLLVTSTSMLISRDWRWNLGILAIQYLGVFWLTYAHWPITMAAVKLVTGWMACAALGMTQISVGAAPTTETAWPQSRLFRVAAAGLIWATSLALAFRTASWLGMDFPIAWGSLLLMGMGLLYLGITVQPMRIIIGLLTLLAGFEILYAAVENSALVAALLTVVNLGLALAGAYLISASSKKDEVI
jgi:hypothetical protein